MFISPNLSRSSSRIPFSPINARRSLFGDDGRPQFLFEADDDKNPGGDNNQSQNPPNQPNIEDAVDKRIAQLLGSKKANNDPMEALAISVKAQNRLETEVERLKSGQMNEADRASLQAAKDLLAAYEAKDFTELKAKLDSGQAAIQERDTLKKTGQMREAVEAAGFDYADFASRKGVDDWTYEVKDENRDGKTVKVPYVTVEVDGKATTKPLAEHASATFPTLAKAEGGQTVKRGFVKQGVTGAQPSVFDRIREEKAAKNDLAQQPPSWKQQVGLASD